MAAIETLIRAKLVEWATAVFGSTLSDPLTIRAEAPEPGDLPDAPTLSLWFEEISHEIESPARLGAKATTVPTYWGSPFGSFFGASPTQIAGWILGEKQADLSVLWRVSGRADALAVREAMADELATTAIAYGGDAGSGIPVNLAAGQALTHKWALDWASILGTTVDEEISALSVAVYWSGADELETPEDTGIRDLYQLRYGALIAYPWAAKAAIPFWHAYLENEEPDGSTFRFDLDDWQGA